MWATLKSIRRNIKELSNLTVDGGCVCGLASGMLQFDSILSLLQSTNALFILFLRTALIVCSVLLVLLIVGSTQNRVPLSANTDSGDTLLFRPLSLLFPLKGMAVKSKLL